MNDDRIKDAIARLGSDAEPLPAWQARVLAKIGLSGCLDHWHCDPHKVSHRCDAANRKRPCPSCGAVPPSRIDRLVAQMERRPLWKNMLIAVVMGTAFGAVLIVPYRLLHRPPAAIDSAGEVMQHLNQRNRSCDHNELWPLPRPAPGDCAPSFALTCVAAIDTSTCGCLSRWSTWEACAPIFHDYKSAADTLDPPK